MEHKLDELYSGGDCKGDVAVDVGRDCGATAVSRGAAHAEAMHRTSPAHFAWIVRTRAASEQIEHIECVAADEREPKLGLARHFHVETQRHAAVAELAAADSAVHAVPKQTPAL